MSTVYEVVVNATHQSKEHTNVFHVYDGDDNAVPLTILNIFVTNFCTALLPFLNSKFTFDQITVNSITALNPGFATLALNLTGTAVGDAMPTGVHMWIKLISDDIGFRAGGKLLGGGVEDSWDGGQPDTAYLDGLQTVVDALITALTVGASVYLAIFRPTLSFPGLPQISICSSATVRGDSTNNRRGKPFER